MDRSWRSVIYEWVVKVSRRDRGQPIGQWVDLLEHPMIGRWMMAETGINMTDVDLDYCYYQSSFELLTKILNRPRRVVYAYWEQ